YSPIRGRSHSTTRGSGSASLRSRDGMSLRLQKSHRSRQFGQDLLRSWSKAIPNGITAGSVWSSMRRLRSRFIGPLSMFYRDNHVNEANMGVWGGETPRDLPPPPP